MKNLIALFSASCLLLSIAGGCKSVVTADLLPADARTFLSEHFPGTPVSYATKEFNEYDVILVDGAEIEFNSKGEWKVVDMNRGVVPAAIVASLPSPVSSFLSSSFTGIPVEKIEKGFIPAYKVELANDLELEFNSKGVCKKIDD